MSVTPVTSESIKSKQVRVLRRAIMNGKLYTRENDCVGYLKSNPLGKGIDSIEFKSGKRPQFSYRNYVEVKGSKFLEVTVDFGHTSQDMYVILKDDKIVYFTFSNIYAPASSAFETLTECFETYIGSERKTGFISTHKCKVYQHPKNIFVYLSGEVREYPTKQVDDTSGYIRKLYYHY